MTNTIKDVDEIKQEVNDIVINVDEVKRNVMILKKDIENEQKIDGDKLLSETKNADHSTILPNGITITSKGGEGLGCPPKSEISAIYAFNNGYDGYRINVCKTKDGILVCSHDESINHIARNKDGTEIKEEGTYAS